MNKSTFFALLSLAVVVTECNQTKLPDLQGVIDYDVDRAGGNFRNMPMNLTEHSSEYECYLLCANRPGCIAWAYSYCDRYQCWLKFKDRPTTPKKCIVNISMAPSSTLALIYSIFIL